MKVYFLAGEAAPFSSPGSLGDLAGSLAKTLAAQGHDVRVALPQTGAIDRSRFKLASVARLPIAHIAGDQTARVAEACFEGVTFYFIAGPPKPARPVPKDDDQAAGSRSIFFSLAALTLCRVLDWQPDVVHAIDALSGPAVYWLGTDGAHDDFFKPVASAFTIRNLSAMNLNTGSARLLLAHGLAPSDSPLLPDWARHSPLGLGLAHADVLNTLSPSEAREILAPDQVCGLEGLLQARQDRLAGILNGLDLDHWDPSRDRQIKARYDASRLERRAANKRDLQRELGPSAQPRRLLIGMILRPDTPDGVGLALSALRELLAGTGAVQLAVLGTGRLAPEAQVKALARDFPDQVQAVHRPGAGLAHRIYAGVDLLLVPAPSEAGVQDAMVAQRYGALPLVPQSGGLGDSVIDASRPQRGTGFTFTDYNSSALLETLRRALASWRRPSQWQALQRRGMRQALGFAWTHSAEAYLELYRQAITLRRGQL